MFEPFSGFEEVVISLEVEWLGRTRPVEVRVERWHGKQERAVLVCVFTDEERGSEWLVVEASDEPHFILPYFVGKLDRLLFYRPAFDVCTRERVLIPTVKDRRLARLQRIVRSAFQGGQFRVVRSFKLHGLPHEPRLALQMGDGGIWCWLQKHRGSAFRFPSSSFDDAAEAMGELLWQQWHHEESDTRFAWEWAQRDTQERKVLCCGGNFDFQELERVMLWVLRCSQKLWDSGSSWGWAIHPEMAARGCVANMSYSGRHLLLSLSEWQEWLFDHFASGWRADWLENHECVQQFWQSTGALQRVGLDEPPTLHERLEARLELRAWLDGKASPEEIEALLSSL